MNPPIPSVAVLTVIVNYRTPELTIDCLRSLVDQRRQVPGLRVVVTDNASGDDSVERLEQFVRAERLQEWVNILPLPRNGGFAYGNNAAIRPALAGDQPPDYVLLLNPDTVVREGAIAILLQFLIDHPHIGMAGSRLEDPDGMPQRSAFRFPTIAGELDKALRLGLVSRLLRSYIVAPPVPEHETETDWVAGASLLVRREVFDTIGLLDEQYFMYYEEVDYCWRARQAGWPCWYVPASRVVHLVGQASGVTNTRIKRKRRPDYWFESRRRYFLRNKGACYSAACDLAMLAGLTVWGMRCYVERKRNDDPPRLLLDSFRHSVFVRGFSA
jgi:N-acetylglucosaminyl-diphospho-decaprenol L-rhamnosyltransferase